MLAVMINLPKWLLAAVMFCVVIGHLEQIESRFKDCCPVATHSGADAPAPGDGGDHGHCSCLCHFNGPVPLSSSQFLTISRPAQEVSFVRLLVYAPEAPYRSVEYPPRSLVA